MNVELLRKIAAVIQEKPEEFSMDYFTGNMGCGTTHCIGGWAAVLSGKEESATTEEEMAELLGVSISAAGRLFYPKDDNGFGGMDATPQQAAARIEHFIATNGDE